MKRSFSIATILAARALPAGCNLSSKTTTASDGLDPVNKAAGDLALGGHDAVAYFQENRPVEESSNFTIVI